MPLVSAVLLSYNCESLVSDAVRSILRQDYAGPMEIVTSDDASTDRTFEVLQAELAGSGRRTCLLRRSASMIHAEMTAGLLAPATLSRVSALWQLLRARAYPDETLQHAALALAPEAYLAYKRRSLGVRR